MRKPIEPEVTRMAKIIEVIETVSTRGNGVDTVHRQVIQYWTKEGKLLAEHDPCANDNMDKLSKVTILQLVQQLEDGLTHDILNENLSVAEFLTKYLNN
jgi:Fe2+ transport system protein B